MQTIFFNDRFGLLLMIDFSYLRFEYEITFLIIGLRAKHNYFNPYIYIYIYIYIKRGRGGHKIQPS
jgi:hypothetical protein